MQTGTEVRGRDIDVGSLCRAMSSALYSLRAYRQNRAAAIYEYTGANWSENSSNNKRQVVNLLALYVSIMGRQLIANQPRFMLSTFNPKAKAAVSKMQGWLNAEVDRMDLAQTLQRTVVDALFSVGITKVGITDPGHSATKGWKVPSGTPYAATVDLDDFVFDQHARTFHDVGYIGHRYRMPLRVAKEMKQFDPKVRKVLAASTDPRFTSEGDERVDSLGRAYTGDAYEYEDMVDLWEIYLPRDQVLVTLNGDSIGTGVGPNSSDIPLRVQKWIGSEDGPYPDILGFGLVPNNAMPKSPIQDLFDLAQLNSNMWRKLDRMIRRMKVYTACRGGADQDGNRIVNVNDGEMIRVDDPDSIKEMLMGGPNAVLMGAAFQIKDLFSLLGGNLELVAGLSPQSKTATQDKMLNENASAILAGMQSVVTRHVSKVGKVLAWLNWHHPMRMMRHTELLPGLPKGFELTRTLSPQDRAQIPWDDLDIKVDPYSLPFQSPSQRMQFLDSTVQATLPLMPLLQQQGIMFDVNYYLQKKAEYGDQPDLAQMFTIQPPPAADQEGQSQPEQPGMQPETTRNYVRRSLGQDTVANRANDMQNMARELGASRNGQPSSNGTGY